MLPTGLLPQQTKLGRFDCHVDLKSLRPCSLAKRFWSGLMRLCILSNTWAHLLSGLVSWWEKTFLLPAKTLLRMQTAWRTGWVKISSTNTTAPPNLYAVICVVIYLKILILRSIRKLWLALMRASTKSGGSIAHKTLIQSIGMLCTTT